MMSNETIVAEFGEATPRTRLLELSYGAQVNNAREHGDDNCVNGL
jgi:hypothetical protein